jgi:hypothetical protein
VLQLPGRRIWWLPAILDGLLPHVAIEAPMVAGNRFEGADEPVLDEVAG